MSNESKPQEWFYLNDETWNGPLKTSGLKNLVIKGEIGPSTLLRLGSKGQPFKASRVKDLLLLLINKDMVLIPAGTFKMGSPSSEKGRADDESLHQVTIRSPYYMGKYEVTQEQWEAVIGNNPSSKNKGAKLPVTDVSWEDCQVFLKRLNEKSNSGYRLPTEAEWEYGCRAGTTTAYSFGDKITPKDANYRGSNIGKPVAVGSYKPNAFGLYDMHGNIWEWCEDWYSKYPAESITDPQGPEMGDYRVLRGGSFDFSVSELRSSIRHLFTPAFRHNDFGFRLARTP